MSKVKWKQVTFLLPLNSERHSQDEVDISGAPFFVIGCTEQVGVNRGALCEPYVCFYTGDGSNSNEEFTYQRPLKEVLEFLVECRQGSDGAEIELAEALCSALEKWRAKHFQKSLEPAEAKVSHDAGGIRLPARRL